MKNSENQTAERTSAGRVWIELARRHMEALREGDEPRRARLFDLLSQIEAEFPDSVMTDASNQTAIPSGFDVDLRREGAILTLTIYCPAVDVATHLHARLMASAQAGCIELKMNITESTNLATKVLS